MLLSLANTPQNCRNSSIFMKSLVWAYTCLLGVVVTENVMTSPFYPLRSENARPSPATPRSELDTEPPLHLDDLVRRVQVGDAGGMLALYEYILTGLRPYL